MTRNAVPKKTFNQANELFKTSNDVLEESLVYREHCSLGTILPQYSIHLHEQRSILSDSMNSLKGIQFGNNNPSDSGKNQFQSMMSRADESILSHKS